MFSNLKKKVGVIPTPIPYHLRTVYSVEVTTDDGVDTWSLCVLKQTDSRNHDILYKLLNPETHQTQSTPQNKYIKKPSLIRLETWVGTDSHDGNIKDRTPE